MLRCAWSTAAAAGGPRDTRECPPMPNCDRSTLSGIVFTSAPSRSYTLIVCRYIMFCANTRPVPDGATDFGEIGPLIVRTCVSRNERAGSCGIVVVVVVGRTVVVDEGGAVTRVVEFAASTGT